MKTQHCTNTFSCLSECLSKLVSLFSQGFQQLKYVALTNCKSLVSMPDLSCTPNLEELHLRNCENLIEAHESIVYHDKLQVLKFNRCSKLSVFPNVLKSKNLRDLWIVDCTKFERFPDIPRKLKGLKQLHLYGIAIKELPASIENLCSLELMFLNGCMNLTRLPSTIYKLQNIKELQITGCKNLIGFPKYEESACPGMKIGLANLQFLSLLACNLFEVEFLEDLSCFPFLRELDLGYNNITSLPTSISKRYGLSHLHLDGCRQLQEIPKLPPNLKLLHPEKCESMQTNGHLTSIDQWVRQALTRVDTASLAQGSFYSCLRIPGGEMLKWFQPVEEDFVSFMASKDLYDKFLGLVFCAVVSNDGANKPCLVRIVAHFNGKRRGDIRDASPWLSSDHVSLQYCTPSDLWEVVDFGQTDGGCAQFSLIQLSGTVKKWGFRIICKQLEDDLKVEIRDNQLIDPAFIYEFGHGSTDPEAKSSHMHEDSPIEIDLLTNFQNCQTNTEKRSQIGSKRKHELILPQSWLHL